MNVFQKLLLKMAGVKLTYEVRSFKPNARKKTSGKLLGSFEGDYGEAERFFVGRRLAAGWRLNLEAHAVLNSRQEAIGINDPYEETEEEITLTGDGPESEADYIVEPQTPAKVTAVTWQSNPEWDESDHECDTIGPLKIVDGTPLPSCSKCWKPIGV